MTAPASIASVAGAIAAAAEAQAQLAMPHDHGGAAPSLATLGGALEFSDAAGRSIGAADFRGHWTLLFFGYSRCRASCPVAIPKMVRTAERLREGGMPTRAMFVDIDVPPLGAMRFRRPGAAAAMAAHADHAHGHGELDRIAAMRALAKGFAGRLIVATGTRGQLAAATRAFNVAREHIPPRPGEVGHSINHSSLIYFLAPDTRVAGYAMHDEPPAMLERTLRRLERRHG